MTKREKYIFKKFELCFFNNPKTIFMPDSVYDLVVTFFNAINKNNLYMRKCDYIKDRSGGVLNDRSGGGK